MKFSLGKTETAVKLMTSVILLSREPSAFFVTKGGFLCYFHSL